MKGGMEWILLKCCSNMSVIQCPVFDILSIITEVNF
uniref:Uncharacterized protein n=1 Tax=Anguilla anguilla TaxID=7936 RepID=A0A0E9P836_ANGAN